jgi:hypothetical protein
MTDPTLKIKLGVPLMVENTHYPAGQALDVETGRAIDLIASGHAESIDPDAAAKVRDARKRLSSSRFIPDIDI